MEKIDEPNHETSLVQRYSTGIKVTIVTALVLLLLIPVEMVQGIINERQFRKDEVVREVSGKWSEAQILTPPTLSIPCNVKTIENGKATTLRTAIHVMPERVGISGRVVPEILKRGIFEVIVYRAEIDIEGEFGKLDLQNIGETPSAIMLDKANVELGLSDLRGLTEILQITIAGKTFEMQPGVNNTHVVPNGLSKMIDLTELQGSSIPFNCKIRLKGSEELFFTPVAKQTSVNISSPWNSPSFDGNFLPDKREVREDGFTASWKIPQASRPFTDAWVGDKYKVSSSAFGVKFVLPVNNYLASERSVKYALLVIGLTFLTFFFMEYLKGKYIHPIQYILVGFALCLFYSLLVSFSEQISFSLSYLIAALMTSGLISVYLLGILREKMMGLFVFLALNALYGFIYILIQQEDYALLMGSLGLFIILGIVMYFSRKIDWRIK